MTAATRQSLLLAALLIVLAAVVVYQMRGADPTAGPAAASNPVAGGQAARAGDAVTDVQLERLTTENAAFRPPRRDPFRFRAAAPPPQEPAFVAPAPSQPPPPPPPSRPPISASLRLIGIYELEGRRVAVLHDGTQSPPVHGMEGDVIEGRYRLLRVDDSAIEISYLDGGLPQRIPLPGQ